MKNPKNQDIDFIDIAKKRAEAVKTGKSTTTSWEEVKKANGLEETGELTAEKVAELRENIDFSDIPELTEADFERGYFKYLKPKKKD